MFIKKDLHLIEYRGTAFACGDDGCNFVLIRRNIAGSGESRLHVKDDFVKNIHMACKLAIVTLCRNALLVDLVKYAVSPSAFRRHYKKTYKVSFVPNCNEVTNGKAKGHFAD
jgi:hypothetical protein